MRLLSRAFLLMSLWLLIIGFVVSVEFSESPAWTNESIPITVNNTEDASASATSPMEGVGMLDPRTRIDQEEWLSKKMLKDDAAHRECGRQTLCRLHIPPPPLNARKS